jgi:hypothetical protein
MVAELLRNRLSKLILDSYLSKGRETASFGRCRNQEIRTNFERPGFKQLAAAEYRGECRYPYPSRPSALPPEQPSEEGTKRLILTTSGRTAGRA